MDNDVYGKALSDFHHDGKLKWPLQLHSSYGDTDEMPIDVFFREEEYFSELELIALTLCDGSILDVGAGAGAHALYLQKHGHNVTALEISNTASDIMRMRGVESVITQDFFMLRHQQYDTLLLLMNGIGLAGSLDGFRRFLSQAKTLLSDRGQLLFDTSDISYLYDDYDVEKPKGYFGEIVFQYAYGGCMGEPFPWLYLDQQTLIRIAREEGWVVQILFEDEHDQYLVRMEPRHDDTRQADLLSVEQRPRVGMNNITGKSS